MVENIKTDGVPYNASPHNSAELMTTSSLIDTVGDVLHAFDPYAGSVNRHLFRLVNGQMLMDSIRALPSASLAIKESVDCFIFEDHYSYSDTSFPGCFPNTASVIAKPSLLIRNSYLDPSLWASNPIAAWNSLMFSIANAAFIGATIYLTGGMRGVIKTQSATYIKSLSMKPIKTNIPIAVEIGEDVTWFRFKGKIWDTGTETWLEATRMSGGSADRMITFAEEVTSRATKIGYQTNRSYEANQGFFQMSRFKDIEARIKTRLTTRTPNDPVKILIVGDGDGYLSSGLAKKFKNDVKIYNLTNHPLQMEHMEIVLEKGSFGGEMLTDIDAISTIPWRGMDMSIDLLAGATWAKEPLLAAEKAINSLRVGGEAVFISNEPLFQQVARYTQRVHGNNPSIDSLATKQIFLTSKPMHPPLVDLFDGPSMAIPSSMVDGFSSIPLLNITGHTMGFQPGTIVHAVRLSKLPISLKKCRATILDVK